MLIGTPYYCLRVLLLALLSRLSLQQPKECKPAAPFPHLQNLVGLCHHLSKVCVDQNMYVLYAEEDDPRSPKYIPRPPINFTNLYSDWHGFSDAWGTQIRYPNPVVRPATDGEETIELQQPSFSKCTVPVVWYINYLNIFGEFYMRTATGLFIMQQNGWVDANMTMVIASLNMRLESYHYRWLQPFTARSITTLSHFSSRLPRERPEPYTAEGTHERCFENLYICEVQWLLLWDYPRPFFSAAHHIMGYYEKQLAAPAPELADPSVLKVMFVDREHTNTRNILNLRQLMQWCRGLQLSLLKSMATPYTRTHCMVHRMGRMLRDMSLVRHFDVLVGLHGSGLFNAFFMREHSSIVEVRPVGFSGAWPNQYLQKMCITDDKDALFWWGINTVTPDMCTPGRLEAQGKGSSATWPRDRNVRIAVPALELVFRQILEVNRSARAYRQKVDSLQYYFTDTLKQLNQDD